jgi:hypothetical protein
MLSGSLTAIILILGFVALRFAWQLWTRRSRENYSLYIIFGVVGLGIFIAFLRGHPVGGDARIALAVAGTLVLAAVMGVLGARTVRVWREGGRLLIRGSWLNGVVWAVAMGAPIGYDFLVMGGVRNGSIVFSATVVLYLVAFLGVQRFTLLSRASRLEAAGQLDTIG